MLPVEKASSDSSMLSTTESLTVAPSAKFRSCESRSGFRSVSFSCERSTGVASSKKVPWLGWLVLRARMEMLGLKALEGPVGVAGRGSSCAKSCIVSIGKGSVASLQRQSTPCGWNRLRKYLRQQADGRRASNRCTKLSGTKLDGPFARINSRGSTTSMQQSIPGEDYGRGMIHARNSRLNCICALGCGDAAPPTVRGFRCSADGRRW
jgi:hypothetical protein